MGIINRDLGRSEKRKDRPFVFGALATGVTQLLQIVEYDSVLEGVNVAAFGLSNSPVWNLTAYRFNATGGLTTMSVAASLALAAIGTSGCIGFSMAAPGVSLAAGDVLMLTTSGSNASVASSCLSLVLRPSADIRVFQNTVA